MGVVDLLLIVCRLVERLHAIKKIHLCFILLAGRKSPVFYVCHSHRRKGTLFFDRFTNMLTDMFTKMALIVCTYNII